jgi:hypothetical protein
VSRCRHGLPERRCYDCSSDIPTGGVLAWLVVLAALAAAVLVVVLTR